jgi:hypothetical protein
MKTHGSRERQKVQVNGYDGVIPVSVDDANKPTNTHGFTLGRHYMFVGQTGRLAIGRQYPFIGWAPSRGIVIDDNGQEKIVSTDMSKSEHLVRYVPGADFDEPTETVLCGIMLPYRIGDRFSKLEDPPVEKQPSIEDVLASFIASFEEENTEETGD